MGEDFGRYAGAGPAAQIPSRLLDLWERRGSADLEEYPHLKKRALPACLQIQVSGWRPAYSSNCTGARIDKDKWDACVCRRICIKAHRAKSGLNVERECGMPIKARLPDRGTQAS